MVRRAGFEPTTFWFVAKHSIQLSYRRINTLIIRFRHCFAKSCQPKHFFIKIFLIKMAESKGFEPSIQLFNRILA